MTDQQFYTFLILMIILIAFVITIIVFQINTSKYIIGKKFKLKNFLYSNSESNTEEPESIKYLINNPNFIDSRILGFGYLFKGHTIDYKKNYEEQNDLDKIVISSRDFLEMDIDKIELLNTIRYFNKGPKKIYKLKLYVIDHQGDTTKANVSVIKKYINNCFKEERKKLEAEKKEVIKQNKEMLRQQKKDQKIILKNKKAAMKAFDKSVKIDKTKTKFKVYSPSMEPSTKFDTVVDDIKPTDINKEPIINSSVDDYNENFDNDVIDNNIEEEILDNNIDDYIENIDDEDDDLI